MGRKRQPPPDPERDADEPRSPSALAWASFVREYNRRAAELSLSFIAPITLGSLARGEYVTPASDALRVDFFARLIDELAPLADTGLKTGLLLQRSVEISNEAVEELRRRSAGLARGPGARRQ